VSRRIRQHRSRLRIINDILTVAKHGARKTHIMYRANLSYDQLNEYLTFLLDNGLIEKAADSEYDGAVVYKVSDKGRLFLERYAQLQEILVQRPGTAKGYDLSVLEE
jgi:predicted transcriptional regulator